MTTSTIVVGAQWGDEGKGKLVDVLSEKSDLVVRFNGGGNAGHTVQHAGQTFKFHYLPSGILHFKLCVLGTGVVIYPEDLLSEIEQFRAAGYTPDIRLSARAHVIFPHHRLLDAKKGGKIGTTGRGIGPTYSHKTSRINLRILDLIKADAVARIESAIEDLKETLLSEEIYAAGAFSEYTHSIAQEYASIGKRLKPLVTDTEALVQEYQRARKSVLFEGAQGAMLDLNYGTYPFVTSCNTIAAGAYTGGGAIPGAPIRIIGITKAYTTRVGAGPFPTELFDESGDNLREAGHEYGTTTGRPRRVGYLDLYALRYAVRLSGIQELAITKVDTLGGLDRLKLCTGYKLEGKVIDYFPADSPTLERVTPVYESLEALEVLSPDEWQACHGQGRSALPARIRTYLERIEEFVEVPITIVSHGPDREETIAY